MWGGRRVGGGSFLSGANFVRDKHVLSFKSKIEARNTSCSGLGGVRREGGQRSRDGEREKSGTVAAEKNYDQEVG